MIRYIPTAGSTVAQDLTEALWALARPPEVRLPGEVTTGLFGCVTCLDDSVCLVVDTEYQITVNEEAVLDGIADILQPFIDAGQLPADTNDNLAAYIEANRGQVITVYSAFPQLFKDQSLDLAGMIAAEKLNEPGGIS